LGEADSRKTHHLHQAKTGIDKSFNGTYETYKVALVLICNKICNKTIKQNFSLYENYTQILNKMQMPNGGVRTHYLPGIIPDPNATENVETTCLALYALNEPPQPWRTIPEFPDAIISLICVSLSIIPVLVKRKVSPAIEKYGEGVGRIS
jgi:hypothetical protein